MKDLTPVTLINGRLVLPRSEPRNGALRCADGRIAALGEVTPQDGDRVIDAKGALIAPGLIDTPLLRALFLVIAVAVAVIPCRRLRGGPR